MKMQTLKSTNVESAGWENGTLQVRFKGGGTYVYSEVPEKTWLEFSKAEHPGTFLAQHIKNNFKASKVGVA